jgi:predicted RNA binding protein YcfA (HicA-like mRNA interferase family)
VGEVPTLFFIMKIAKQIEKLMLSRGYRLARSKKHNVWVNNKGHMITTSKTTSDAARLLKNIERDIRKVERV